MSIYFTHPEFFWGILILIPILYIYCKSLIEYSLFQKKMILCIRVIIVIFVLLAIAGMTFRFPSDKKETVFLIDESQSVDGNAKAFCDDYIRRVMDFDKSSLYKTYYFSRTLENHRKKAPSGNYDQETNIERALFSAMASCEHNAQSQIVLFSDGNETDGNALNAVIYNKIPVSTIPLSVSSQDEVQIANINVPQSVRKNEPFCTEVEVRSNVETEGKLSVYRNGIRTNTQTISLVPGQNKFSFEMEGDESNEMQITALSEAVKDTLIENNTRTAFVITEGNPAILMFEKNSELAREFVKAMKEQGIRIEVRTQEGFPKESDQLGKYDAVIFADIPATALTRRQMEMIKSYVADRGGGFIMLGGENSFGPGGYGKTPLADIMPVDFQFEKEKETPGLAIGLVLDRSGSMNGEKLELTKEAARGVVELLSPRDYISVIAFDSVPHKIVPLQNVMTPSVIHQMIGSISAEGGTNIYGALNETLQEMMRADAKVKHIILLTDGHSTAGDYENIIRQFNDAGISVSAVGMGNCDRFLLEKLAKDGHGRFYACDNPRSVPQIFAREISMADRSAFSEKPFFPVPESVLPLLKNVSLDKFPPLLGNVRVHSKKTSETHLTTETGDPLLVSWRFGLGMSLAFTSDVSGRWSAEWLQCSEFSKFWAQILRFTMRHRSSAHAEMQIIPSDKKVAVAADIRNPYDEFVNDANGNLFILDSLGNKSSLKMNCIAPGKYTASFPVKANEKYMIQTVLKTSTEELIRTSRTFIADTNKETNVLPVNTQLLKQLATVSKGKYNPSPEDAVQHYQTQNCHRLVSLSGSLLIIALILFVADVFVRRINFI